MADGAVFDGAGKRAAFALYYGPMHFLLVREIARGLGPSAASPRRILDLGCGTGTAGAAWALECGPRTRVEAVDRSGWAVAEARWTLVAVRAGRPRDARRRLIRRAAVAPGRHPRRVHGERARGRRAQAPSAPPPRRGAGGLERPRGRADLQAGHAVVAGVGGGVPRARGVARTSGACARSLPRAARAHRQGRRPRHPRADRPIARPGRTGGARAGGIGPSTGVTSERMGLSSRRGRAPCPPDARGGPHAQAHVRQPPHLPGAERDHRGRDARLPPRPGRPAARGAERPHQRGLRRLRHAGAAPADPRAQEPRPSHRGGLRSQPEERGLRRVVPPRAARHGAGLPLRPDLGRGDARVPLRARGRPGARGQALRLEAGRGLPRVHGLPGDAGEGEGPRRRLHHDAGPPPRHGRARGHEGREARDRPQASRQRPARGTAGDRHRARDGRRHAHVLRGRPAVDAPAVRVDPGRRDRPGARGAQLVDAALLAAGHDHPPERGRPRPGRASTGTCGSARCRTGRTAPPTRTRSSAGGTTSAPAPSATWGTTRSSRSSRS